MFLIFWLGIIFIIIVLSKNAVVKGIAGEFVVNVALKFGLDSGTYKLLKNTIISDQDGGTTQIDHVVISPFGIFVIETKNMKGWIFGDRNSAVWTQQIFKSKNKFQNPFFQNHKHVKCLAELIDIDEKYFNHVIAFVGDCEIKTKDKLPPSLVTGGIGVISYIKTHKELFFDTETVERLVSLINDSRIENNWQNRKAHINYAKSIVKSKKNNNSIPNCPACGAVMAKRQAKRGNNKGNFFWGCTNYPKCRKIINLNINE